MKCVFDDDYSDNLAEFSITYQLGAVAWLTLVACQLHIMQATPRLTFASDTFFRGD